MYEFLLGNDKYPPIAEPYITSFCAAESGSEHDHGLLSQWRGYGGDGGYVIGFHTLGIEKLLEKEVGKWQYGFLQGGDVLIPDDWFSQVEHT